MTRKSRNDDALARMRAANPSSATELREAITNADLSLAMQRAIAVGESPSRPIPVGDRVAYEHAARIRSARRGVFSWHRGASLSLGGLACVVLVAALILLSGGSVNSVRDGAHPAFAAAAVKVAEANPRLLVTAPGWRIVRADEFEPDSGELAFTDRNHRFAIHWYPARLYERYRRDRAYVSTPERGILLGQRATTVEYSPEEYATMLSPQGSVFIEVRGRLGSKRAYDEILHSLRPVSIETWLSAMPPSTVRPGVRSKAIDQMLGGIPLPTGFDATVLQSEGSISDQSSLAVKVGNAVACGWVESWIAAQAAGDHAATARAVEAMAGSANWPIVRKTKVPWFSNYAIVTKQMRAGRLDRSASSYEVQTNGKTFAFGPAWKLILGCAGTYRREVDGIPGEGPNPGHPGGGKR
jgi:hypothetical protein